MKVRRLVVLLALTLMIGFVGAKQGLAFVQAKYGAPCSKLEGFGGVLQDLNLLAQGDCKLKKGSTTKCQDSSICTISNASGTLRGKCSDALGACSCVVGSGS
jgi:hypothetical protein